MTGTVPTSVAFDEYAEKAVLGSLMLVGDPRVVAAMTAQGLRPTHFYRDTHAAVFTAAVALCDRQAPIDTITLWAELERLGLRNGLNRLALEDLAGYVPAAGHRSAYADRVIELARWRFRQRATYEMQKAVELRDTEAWARTSADLELATGGSRTDSYSGDQWGALLFDHFSRSPEELAAMAVPWPFNKLTEALGGGLRPGEWAALSGPTSHGKSTLADMCLDTAAKHGKRCHLYMTEMTAIARGMRYLARRTGVSFMKQRRNQLTAADTTKILAELGHLPYGCTMAADWNPDDIVRDALRARYDFVVVDLIHGFHYEDERGLDKLSKSMQKLARVSTTLDGHPGTAVIAVTHLKEEGTKNGQVPRPTITSIKGGSSIKQDADFVAFVWQEQDEDGAPNGEAEIWLAKGRNGELCKELVRINPVRFRFELRDDDPTVPSPSQHKAPF